MPREIIIRPYGNHYIFYGLDDFSTEEMRLIAAAVGKMAHANSMCVSNFLNREMEDSKLFKGVKNNHYVK